MDLRDPEIVQLFGEIRRENIDAKSVEILMEHFAGRPQEHHSDMSLCNYVGSDCSDSEDDMEGVNLFKLENKKWAMCSKLCAEMLKVGRKWRLRRPH